MNKLTLEAARALNDPDQNAAVARALGWEYRLKVSNARLAAECAAMREALEFYRDADYAHLCDEGRVASELLADNGMRADTALSSPSPAVVRVEAAVKAMEAMPEYYPTVAGDICPWCNRHEGDGHQGYCENAAFRAAKAAARRLVVDTQ